MAQHANDSYGEFGSVPQTQAEPAGRAMAEPMRVQASAADFGGQVGGAVEKLGQEGQQISLKYAQMASEANAQDKIANEWAPQVAKLSGAYQQLQGKDAVAGLGAFQQSLTDMHKQFIANASSPYERQILSAYMSRHVAQEMDSAQRHQDTELTKFEDNSSQAYLGALSDRAVNSYNDPDVVAQVRSMMEGQIDKHIGVDRGQSDEFVTEHKRQVWGHTVEQMVTRATLAGDVATANQLYGSNKDFVDGAARDKIERLLHTENMRQNGYNDWNAIKSGQPISNGLGTSALDVQSGVAAAAQSKGVPVNDALAVASVESDMGRRTGARGTIGQNMSLKPGSSKEEQYNALVNDLAEARVNAVRVIPNFTPSQAYVCYQQGAGGGPALLKDAQKPLEEQDKAVNILLPLYEGDRTKALSAVVKNGGNASMTSGQFCQMVQDNYDAHAKRAEVQIASNEGQTSDVPNAILAPSQKQSVATQPAANPLKAWQQMQDNTQAYMNSINGIQNLDRRNAAYEAYKQDRERTKIEADDYKAGLERQVTQLANNPKFTSMDMVPPDLMASINDGTTDGTTIVKHLRDSVNYNLEHASGLDKTKFKMGDDYLNGMARLILPQDDPNRISTAPQIWKLQQDGGLTPEGAKDLESKLKDMNVGNLTMQNNALKEAEMQIIGPAKLDPEKRNEFDAYAAWFSRAYNDGIGKGYTPNELLDPDSKNSLLAPNVIKYFQRPAAERAASTIKDPAEWAPPRTGIDIQADVTSGKIPQAVADFEMKQARLPFYEKVRSGAMTKEDAETQMRNAGLLGN